MKPLFPAAGFLVSGKLLFACQDVIIKEMSGAFPLHEIMVIRGLTSILLIFLSIPLLGGDIEVSGLVGDS